MELVALSTFRTYSSRSKTLLILAHIIMVRDVAADSFTITTSTESNQRLGAFATSISIYLLDANLSLSFSSLASFWVCGNSTGTYHSAKCK